MNRKYRKTIIAGNWKMNKTPSETKEFMTAFKSILPKGRWCDVVFCVPAVCIPAAVRAMRETRVGIGGENVNANASGAYTGEIAANMLVDAGCKYVIIGHSERRAMGETDADVNAKVLAALEAGLIPIVCCGESLEQRETGITDEWIALQVKSALYGVPADKLDLAYGYIPRGDIEETTDGRTGPDPELAYAGDPAAGLGFYCFAQPVAQGANAYLAAQGSALRAADITGVTG